MALKEVTKAPSTMELNNLKRQYKEVSKNQYADTTNMLIKNNTALYLYIQIMLYLCSTKV